MLKKKPDQAEDPIQRALDARKQAAYGGQAGKMKFGANMKAKHQMTRNPRNSIHWRDLQGRHKGLVYGMVIGLAVGGTLYWAITQTEAMQKLIPDATLLSLLGFIVNIIFVVAIGGIGFVLGKTTEQ